MNYQIALLPGDGIGPEIIEQAVKVLESVGRKFSHTFEFTEAPVGAVAIDRTGNPFPPASLFLTRREGIPAWQNIVNDLCFRLLRQVLEITTDAKSPSCNSFLTTDY